MKVLHVIHSLDRAMGGLATAALGVCDGLLESGCPTDLVSGRGLTDSTEYVLAEYPRLAPIFLPQCFPRRYGNSSALVTWVENHAGDYDLVELHGIFSFTVLRVSAVCRRLGVPYLVRPHGSLDPFDLRKHARLKSCLGPLVLRPHLQGSAGVVCTSRLEAERLVSYGATMPRHVVSLPVPNQAAKTGAGRSVFRKRHGIPETAQAVLFLSRIDYKKGLEFLLPALKELKKSNPELWLVLAGDGEPQYVGTINALIESLGIGAWVTRPGFLSGKEKQEAFTAADCFALPSQNENFGIVVVEALQAGLPLVISDEVYIHREIAEQGGAEICQPNRESCLEALRRHFTDSRPLAARQSRARAIAEELFGVKSATESLRRLYAEVAPARHSEVRKRVD